MGLKEGLVKCVTVCVKSEVILFNVDVLLGYPTDTEYSNRELLMVLMFQYHFKMTFLANFNQKSIVFKAKIPFLPLLKSILGFKTQCFSKSD